MRSVRQERLISHAEYFAMCDTTEGFLEYVAGHVYAMTGASKRHNGITAKLISGLAAAAERRGCEVFATGMLVRVDAADAFYAPDVTIVCRQQGSNPRALDAPSVVIEVLSPSTADMDRRYKLRDYKTVPAISEIVIVETDRRLVEIHRRLGNGWEIETVEGEGALELQTIQAFMPLDEIYRTLWSD